MLLTPRRMSVSPSVYWRPPPCRLLCGPIEWRGVMVLCCPLVLRCPCPLSIVCRALCYLRPFSLFVWCCVCCGWGSAVVCAALLRAVLCNIAVLWWCVVVLCVENGRVTCVMNGGWCVVCCVLLFPFSALPFRLCVCCHSIVGLGLCLCDSVVSLWNSGDGICGAEGRVVSTVYTSSVLWCVCCDGSM